MEIEINKDELLKEIESAARRGVEEGTKHVKIGKSSIGGWIKGFLLGALCCFLAITLIVAGIHKRSFTETVHSFFVKDTSVEGHDLTIENNGILGYTAADFAVAILGDGTDLKKLEVYSQEVSDVATIRKAGLGKIKAFSKYQYITYHGQATYTVDLSKLDATNITLDEATKTVTLTVPDVALEPINIPSENIEFGEVEKETVFAFGTIKTTPEEQAQVESEAKNRMIEKLTTDSTVDTARVAATHSIWEIFQPVVSGVAPDYTLQVVVSVPEEPAADAQAPEGTAADTQTSEEKPAADTTQNTEPADNTDTAETDEADEEA